MSHGDESNGDMPRSLKWVLTAINRVGFPIMVCIWLAYQQFTQGREMIKTITEFKEVIISLKTSVDQQTKALRRKALRDD